MELEDLVKLRKYIQKKYKKKLDEDIKESLELLNKLIREKKHQSN